MTYYEELGLGTEASEAEIRSSYQALSRILHPDKQPETVLRKLAAAQLQRLNEVVETLCDDKRRAHYDLRVTPRNDHLLLSDDRDWRHFAEWVAVLGIVCLLCSGFYSVLPAEPVLLHAVTEVGPLILSSPSRISNLERVASIKPVLVIASARIPAKIAGRWVYSSDPLDKPAKWTYSAEYVELQLQEIGGELLRTYRSRYKIPDKPMHPELVFRFGGLAKKREFEWSAGKLRGQIHLKLQQDNVMEASWKIIDEGSVAGLAAGSAIFSRRME